MHRVVDHKNNKRLHKQMAQTAVLNFLLYRVSVAVVAAVAAFLADFDSGRNRDRHGLFNTKYNSTAFYVSSKRIYQIYTKGKTKQYHVLELNFRAVFGTDFLGQTFRKVFGTVFRGHDLRTVFGTGFHRVLGNLFLAAVSHRLLGSLASGVSPLRFSRNLLRRSQFSTTNLSSHSGVFTHENFLPALWPSQIPPENAFSDIGLSLFSFLATRLARNHGSVSCGTAYLHLPQTDFSDLRTVYLRTCVPAYLRTCVLDSREGQRAPEAVPRCIPSYQRTSVPANQRTSEPAYQRTSTYLICVWIQLWCPSTAVLTLLLNWGGCTSEFYFPPCKLALGYVFQLFVPPPPPPRIQYPKGLHRSTTLPPNNTLHSLFLQT
jgi:hypothetical protein